jgi:guanine nucleotide exchange factor MCF2
MVQFKVIRFIIIFNREVDKEKGFTILIDRRNDKWSSVKHILLLIQEYFPAKLNDIFILRPQGYFQRVFSTLFFQEELISTNNTIHKQQSKILSESASSYNNQNKTSHSSSASASSSFKSIKVLKSLEELNQYIDKEQLTIEFGGNIHYRHQEWIEQRQFIEKLSSNVNECVLDIKLFIKTMEETDFPNDVTATEALINTQLNQRANLISTVESTHRYI